MTKPSKGIADGFAGGFAAEDAGIYGKWGTVRLVAQSSGSSGGDLSIGESGGDFAITCHAFRGGCVVWIYFGTQKFVINTRPFAH
jgi:hypothetical protein